MREISDSDINFFTECRTQLETQLAKDLYGVFGQQPIIGALRNLVGLAIENLVPLMNDQNPVLVNRMKSGEHKNLSVWANCHASNNPTDAQSAQAALRTVWEHQDQWSPADCSDLIRLFGDLCEQLKGGEEYRTNATDFDRYKPDEFFFGYDPVKAAAGHKATVQFAQTNPISRTRTGEQSATAKHGYSAPGSHIAQGRGLIKKVKAGGEDGFWGISLYRLMPKSTVRKIDLAFGLPEGADISGTTADSILVVNRVKSFAGAFAALGDSVFSGVPEYALQLLPLVTMVSHGHHTLVESALTLTYHGYITYAIGFYETLMPGDEHLDGMQDQARGAIERVLARANESKLNRHILCYFDQSSKRYRGYLFDKPGELEKFKRFATVGEDLLRRFRDRVSPLVTKTEVDSLWAQA
jgi:hypothetical protein